MKKLRILHLASFCGNMGDIASHNGLYNSILKDLEYEVTKLEMRLFYQNCKKRVFDEEFCEYINTFDLLIIGGGGFLAIGFENSKTATTIDIEKEVFDRITIPVIFNSIGINECTPATEEMYEKFSDFMNYLTDKSNVLLALRNDNGIKILRRCLGEENCTSVKQVYDCGFFSEIPDYFQPNIIENKVNVAVNIAGDMIDVRVGDLGNGLRIEQFVDDMADLLIKIMKSIPNANIVFVPHIMADMDITVAVMKKIPDEYSRYRMSVASCLYQNENALSNFDIYRKCDCVVVMRNHAAIVSLAQGCNVIGLGTLDDFKGVFESVDLEEYCIDIEKKDCFNKIFKKVLGLIEGTEEYPKSRIYEMICQKEKEMRELYETWIYEKCGNLKE